MSKVSAAIPRFAPYPTDPGGAGWTVSNGELKNVYSATQHSNLDMLTTDADQEIAFTYEINDTSSNGYGVHANLRWVDGDNRLQVRFFPNKADIMEKASGAWSSLDSDIGVTSSEDTRYRVRIVADGSDITVYRAEEGGQETEILSATTTHSSTTRVRMLGLKGGDYTIDDVRILADDLSSTITQNVNAANELTSVVGDHIGTISFGYDELGRMTSKSRGSESATYAYDYDDRLVSVTSSFPHEGDVTYTYGANGMRRSRTFDGTTTNYNWNGWVLASEEDNSGNLTRSYVGRSMAHIDGSNPSTGTYSYYLHDHLTSTRMLFDGSQNELASYEFTPYGEAYAFDGNETDRLYTGHDLDRVTGLYSTPFRWYAPEFARWTTIDPLGMIDGPNMYAYVAGNPVWHVDFSGRGIFDKLRDWFGGRRGDAFDKALDYGAKCGGAAGIFAAETLIFGGIGKIGASQLFGSFPARFAGMAPGAVQAEYQAAAAGLPGVVGKRAGNFVGRAPLGLFHEAKAAKAVSEAITGRKNNAKCLFGLI